jgi:20S proteasome subunit beta 2
MSRDLELHALNTGSEIRVITAVTRMVNHLFRYGGYIGAYLIVGGHDVTGPHLCYVSADGNTIWQPFLATGSGSLAAISILESGYKENLSMEEGMKLVQSAISGGVFHDMGSGQNIDICVLERGKKANYHRNIVKVHQKIPKAMPYTMQKIIILKEEVKQIKNEPTPMEDVKEAKK